LHDWLQNEAHQGGSVVINEAQLKVKIKFWIREYGWGGMPHSGASSNILQTLIDHKGFVPTAKGYTGIALQTIGDEVESAVRIMEQMPGEAGDENVCFKGAMALRAYYLTPKYWPEEERISRMALIGLRMSKPTFYKFVQLGRAFLMGYLNSREKVPEHDDATENTYATGSA
jgi:hypothetical protein